MLFDSGGFFISLNRSVVCAWGIINIKTIIIFKKGDLMPKYKAIADETVSILKSGKYASDLRTVMLDMDNIKKVILYPDSQLVQAEKSNTYDTKFKVYDRDTVTAVFDCPSPEKCAVLNFASAKHPGGGFITGANAQEESLCRSSSLYASIGSKSAEDMYIYNIKNKNIFYSDYMLFSPYVTFFRRSSGRLTSNYVNVSVITSPAVNCGIADPQKYTDKIREIMRRRIRKIFDIAIDNNKTYLILGAWGCGVFRNKAEDISNDFKLVLSEEKYKNSFETVEFSVLCGRTPEKLTPFKQNFS